MLAGYSWHKQGSLVMQAIEEEPTGNISLMRPRLRWENYAKKDIKTVRLEIRWKEAADGKIYI